MGWVEARCDNCGADAVGGVVIRTERENTGAVTITRAVILCNPCAIERES